MTGRRGELTYPADAMRRANATIAALRFVLDTRERELLELKGPCSTDGCRLHRAHSGPCHITTEGPR